MSHDAVTEHVCYDTIVTFSVGIAFLHKGTLVMYLHFSNIRTKSEQNIRQNNVRHHWSEWRSAVDLCMVRLRADDITLRLISPASSKCLVTFRGLLPAYDGVPLKFRTVRATFRTKVFVSRVVPFRVNGCATFTYFANR